MFNIHFVSIFYFIRINKHILFVMGSCALSCFSPLVNKQLNLPFSGSYRSVKMPVSSCPHIILAI